MVKKSFFFSKCICQRVKCSLLSKMAIDNVSIPAKSAEVELVFSEAKTTINEGRWRLEIDTIEVL